MRKEKYISVSMQDKRIGKDTVKIEYELRKKYSSNGSQFISAKHDKYRHYSIYVMNTYLCMVPMNHKPPTFEKERKASSI